MAWECLKLNPVRRFGEELLFHGKAHARGSELRLECPMIFDDRLDAQVPSSDPDTVKQVASKESQWGHSRHNLASQEGPEDLTPPNRKDVPPPPKY